jgi:hypothetical protein
MSRLSPAEEAQRMSPSVKAQRLPPSVEAQRVLPSVKAQNAAAPIKAQLRKIKPVVNTTQDTCGFPAPKAAPNQSSTNKDRSPGNRKTPAADLGAEQRIAVAGETVPILFGKRVSNSGGVWIQPPLVKAGSYFFKGSFLFPVSQGEIVSSPVKHRTWVGLRCMAFLDDQTITISNIYNSAATLAGSPGTCPVLGAGMYCGNDTYSFLAESIPATGAYTNRLDYLATSYWGYRTIARGTGDTTNIGILGTVEFFDNVTGADLTAAWFAAIGLPPSTQFEFNQSLEDAAGTSPPAAGGVGIVQDFIDGTGGLGYLSPDPAFFASIGSSGSITEVWDMLGVANPLDSAFPATTGTLTAIQYEYVISKYANPASTPTADNSSYADITFLKVVGDIYDPPEAGSYPTTTRQISIYYEQGIRVALYSVDAAGSTQGASNQLVDLAMYLFTSYKRQTAGTTPDVSRPILTTNMPSLATFCNNYSLQFNGIIAESVNIIELISETAPFFLLSFISTGGQYRFLPVLPLNGSQQISTATLSPAATFTEDEILPGSYSKTYVSAAEKSDVNVTVLFRKNDPDAIGTQQSVQVRYNGVSLDVPVEQFDMSDFCSNRNHAIIYAKHFLARRRYSVHSIEFETTLDTTGLIPTNIICVQKQRISTAGDNRTETEYYQITAIDHNTEGTTSIEAAQFPVHGSTVPTISNEVLNGTFTVV